MDVTILLEPDYYHCIHTRTEGTFGRDPFRRRAQHTRTLVGMQTGLHSSALLLPCSRHTPHTGSVSLPLFRDRLHQKCTATPSTSGRTLSCSAAPATLENHPVTAVKSKRGIKNNSIELIGDTPMVRR